jgi:hypothetical protein
MRAWWSVPVLLVAAQAAAGQTVPSAPPQPSPPQPRAERPRAQIWREPAGPVQAGRLRMPVAGNLQVAVGRFTGPEMTRPHTHTEPIGRIVDIARRDRGRAAVGFSLRF